MLTPPPVRHRGRAWPYQTLNQLAWGWREHVDAVLTPGVAPIAMVMANHPDTVALFFALGSRPRPVMILPLDPRGWRSAPPAPIGTVLCLTPDQSELAAAGADAGLRPLVLPWPPTPAGDLGDVSLDPSGGVIVLTSGSSGPPKPVYRTFRSVGAEVAALVSGYGLVPGPGVLGTLPLSGDHGLVGSLLVAAALRSPLELVDQFDHRTVLALFADGTCQYWPATPVMADVLSRCSLSGPPPRAPRVCTVGAGRLSEAVFHGFRDRFGVTLRPDYGTTENGTVTADMRPADAVRSRAVGRPVPGVQVRIAEDPRHPLPPGTAGPIWLRSPWRMEGYGFPPELDLPVSHGWSPTPDLGQLDAEGCLTLLGRADECFKTLTGHLVHPGEIVEALRSHPGVTDATVVALAGPSGPAIGALVEGDAGVTAQHVRAHVAALLPTWKRPHALLVTSLLPRLPRGKVDRLACAALLEAAAQPDP